MIPRGEWINRPATLPPSAGVSLAACPPVSRTQGQQVVRDTQPCFRWTPALLPQHSHEEVGGLSGNPGTLALPRARDVECRNREFGEPVSDKAAFQRVIEIDHHIRLAMSLGKTESEFRSTGRFTATEDQCSIGVEDVLLRAHGVLSRIHFVEAVLRGNAPVFGQPPARAPAAVGNAQL